MVYSRSAPTRAYIKAVALCALSLAALPLSTAQDGTTATTCEISDDLKSNGIRVVDGPGCANGGLGCYNDHCRYCKIIDTPKSTQYESCSSFGANFPSMAPPVVTTGACEISQGDAAAGIAAVVDADCLYGGLGCFSDHCRFCKAQETQASASFSNCADFDTSTLVTAATVTAPAPPAAAAYSPTSATGASCSLVVSEGDAAVGINIIGDGSCSAGGIGCIDDVCRFCRVKTTVQSAAFTDCNSITGTLTVLVTEPPTDAPTDAPTTDAPTEAPTDAPTEAPTDAPIELPTNAPAELPTEPSTEAPASDSTCQQLAAEGDILSGINIVTDTSCAIGGIGCISDVCRYCRAVYTTQSASFTDCGIILGTVATDAPTDAQTDAPMAAPTVTATDAPTDAPTDVPIDAPTDAPADQPVCTKVVSSGDASVGINIVTDASCVNGGAGCIDDICRFCKVLTTVQSTTFVDCTSITGYSTNVISTSDVVATEAPTSASTDAPTDAPADAATDTPTDASSSAPTDATDAPTDTPSDAPTDAPTDSVTETLTPVEV